ncbi:MAG: Cof-type HAD-IIB family hydrolase [Erysipelotrichales bacterium]|nr:Cof-type HAD-IIB family hydrolase [Erysipelotrichales bacterium]
MKPKAIFFDIDGTLMNTEKGVIPASTIQAIEKLHKQGILVFVATSRCNGEFGNFNKYLEEIPFDGVVSCGGGMLTYHGEIINTEAMNENDVRKIIDYCDEHNIDIRYQSEHNCHLHKEPIKSVYDSFIYFYDYCPSTKAYENEKVVNFLGFGTAQHYHDIMNMCEDLDGVLYSDAFEFTKKDVNKAYGIKKMCYILGIDIQEVMAFGDAENDIAMLQAVGIGVAMGNACDSCKEAADFVTKRCDEDGIAYALEYFEILDDLYLTDQVLCVRQATTNDVDVLLKWWNDGKVMAHAGFPNGLHKTADDIKKEIALNNREKRRLILYYEDQRIGEMSYIKISEGIFDFGIKICEEEYQNRHLGPRYLRLLFDYLFDVLKATKIILDTDLENLRAQKVYERLGFTNKEIHYNSWTNDIGELRSSVSYTMTINDYRKDV